MTRRLTAWVVAGALALGVLGVWGVWTSRLRQHSDRLALQLEAERQRNFHELVGHMQTVQGLLGKGIAAGTVPQNMYYMQETFRRTSLATSNFMALPLPAPLTASLGKFLNQTGDFAFSIARNEAAGRPMDANQRAELTRLQQESTKLATELNAIGQQAARKGFRWVSMAPGLASVFRGQQDANVENAQGGQKQAAKNLLPGGFEKIGPHLDRMPMMIYDGPFSDHLHQRKPAMTGAAISEDEARRRALAAVPDGNRYTVVETVRKNGPLKTFSVRLAPTGTAAGNKAGGPASYSITVDITQEGGYVASIVNARAPGQATLNLQQARDIGKTYLQQHGIANMVATYGEAVDGIATVQFALRERGAMVYPDQVKIRVALDTGEVVGMDARQYINAHRDRGPLEVPAVTQAQAAKVVNPELKVERVQLALIPTEAGDNEVLTYEFMGRLGNDTYLVYVNAKSGEEERIVQVINTPNGTLAL